MYAYLYQRYTSMSQPTVSHALNCLQQRPAYFYSQHTGRLRNPGSLLDKPQQPAKIRAGRQAAEGTSTRQPCTTLTLRRDRQGVGGQHACETRGRRGAAGERTSMLWPRGASASRKPAKSCRPQARLARRAWRASHHSQHRGYRQQVRHVAACPVRQLLTGSPAGHTVQTCSNRQPGITNFIGASKQLLGPLLFKNQVAK